nr:hypothetical protein ISGA_10255 [Gordonia sp. NB41Y]
MNRGIRDEGTEVVVAECLSQSIGVGGGIHHVVVAGHTDRLVLADRMGDQVELVGEVVVQHAVGVLGVLGDLPQAGARISEFGEGVQGGQRQLGAFGRELVPSPLVDAGTRCTRSCHGVTHLHVEPAHPAPEFPV